LGRFDGPLVQWRPSSTRPIPQPVLHVRGDVGEQPDRDEGGLRFQAGNGITFEFITNLAKRGTIFDRQPLRGHEDVIGEYGDIIYWRLRKKGISMHELDRDLAAIDLRKAAKGNLRTWADEDVKWETIDRLGDVGTNCDIPFDAATADKNAWVTNNKDRVLFGAPGRTTPAPSRPRWATSTRPTTS
jgi:hypothetical protein